jgi:type I restriction enzyme S subunit
VMSYKLDTLGKVCDREGGIVQTGPFGSQLHERDYVAEGIPAIMPKDIVDGRINRQSVARITERKADELARHQLRTGAVVLPRRGEINKRAFITEQEEGWLCGTGCIKVELKGVELLPQFLYYYLDLPTTVRWLEQHAVGTTMLNLSASIVRSLPVILPPLQVQRRIASILSTYDNLIENNRRRIQLLEQAARLIYQEWFVRLRYPGHERARVVDGAPERWEKRKLGDILVLNYGKGLKESERIEGDVPVYGSSGVVGSHHRHLAEGPGIIVGRKGNVGSVFWSQSAFFPIDTVYYVDAKTSSLYLFHLLQSLPFQSSDGAVPGLNRSYAYSLPVRVPPKTLVDRFEGIAAPIYQQILNLQRQNERLRQARDLLLPKLMSGEIAV